MKVFCITVLGLIMNIWLFAQDSVLNYTDINGMKQGLWIKKDDEGNKIYEGNFKNNVPYGEFFRYHKNGAVLAKMNHDKDDQKKVYVEIYDDTGELGAKGFFYNKQRDSVWTFYGVNEKLIKEEHYVKGKLNGVSKIFYPSGQLMEEKGWKMGKMHGVWKWYYEEGTPRLEAFHDEDKRVGDFVIYHINGQKYINGSYKADRKHGVWTFYSQKGEKEKHIKFINGTAENQEEIDAQVTKELEEMEKKKGQIEEPNEMNFFNK
ncbi:MAG: hypothetical protein JXR53_14115 [Bacteroidales bacterium]|nr:hypothetical protein [Bacteroidales bacterium]